MASQSTDIASNHFEHTTRFKFSHHAIQPRRPRIHAIEWCKHKDEILFELDKHTSYQHVFNHMRDKYGFAPAISQYRHQVKTWRGSSAVKQTVKSTVKPRRSAGSSDALSERSCGLVGRQRQRDLSLSSSSARRFAPGDNEPVHSRETLQIHGLATAPDFSTWCEEEDGDQPIEGSEYLEHRPLYLQYSPRSRSQANYGTSFSQHVEHKPRSGSRALEINMVPRARTTTYNPRIAESQQVNPDRVGLFARDAFIWCSDMLRGTSEEQIDQCHSSAEALTCGYRRCVITAQLFTFLSRREDLNSIDLEDLAPNKTSSSNEALAWIPVLRDYSKLSLINIIWVLSKLIVGQCRIPTSYLAGWSLGPIALSCIADLACMSKPVIFGLIDSAFQEEHLTICASGRNDEENLLEEGSTSSFKISLTPCLSINPGCAVGSCEYTHLRKRRVDCLSVSSGSSVYSMNANTEVASIQTTPRTTLLSRKTSVSSLSLDLPEMAKDWIGGQQTCAEDEEDDFSVFDWISDEGIG